MNADDLIVSDEALYNLQTAFADVDLRTRAPRGSGGLELLLLERQHVKIRMRREENHVRPHFHIEYKKESSASYSIEPFERLAGDLPLKYEERVRGWVLERQKDLLATWEALQRSDVRELVHAKRKGLTRR